MRTNIEIDDQLVQQAMRYTACAPRKPPSKPACACW
jgi:Arc/MetJ family transcription regulator